MDDQIGKTINTIASELSDMGLGKSIHGIFRVNVKYGFLHKTKSVDVENEIRVEDNGQFPLARKFVGPGGQAMFEVNMGPYFLKLYQENEKLSHDKFSFLTIDVSAEGKHHFSFIYDEDDVPFDVKAAEWQNSLGKETSSENKSVVSTLTKDEEITNRHALNILNSNLSSKSDKLEAIRSLKLVMMVNDESLIDHQYLIAGSEEDDHAFFAHCALTNNLFVTVLQGSDDVHPLVADYKDLYEFGKTFNKDERLSFFIIDGDKGVLLPLELINMAYLAS